MQNKLRKLLTFFTLFFVLLSNLQIGVLYADSVSKLETEKNKSEIILNKVENAVVKIADKIEKKVKNKEVKKRLQDKKKEIKEYLEKVDNKVKSENSKSDIKKLTIEAKKVVVLKVVSGITKQIDVSEKISSDVASTKKEKKEALETIQDSLEDWNKYSLIISTKYSEKKTFSLFKKFDEKIKLDFLYKNWNYNFFEVFISKNSIFANEILEDIKSWNIPERFLGIKIVTPEVFSINLTPNPSPLEEKGNSTQVNLLWEDLNSTWWVQKFNPNNYLEKLKKGYLDGNSIRVWIIDTWIDYNHPELKWRVLKWKDFVNKDDDAWDDQGHWTHVAWTIWAW